MWSLSVFLALVAIVQPYKFLIYNPVFGHSHVVFLSRIADTLTAAGHDVTVLFPVMDKDLEGSSTLRLTKKFHTLPVDPRTDAVMAEARKNTFRMLWSNSPDVMALIQVSKNMSIMCTYTCEALLDNEKLEKVLREEKFDVGIVEPFFACGAGYMKHLNIPTTVGALSTTGLDVLSAAIGEPIAPSFVPGTMSLTGDKMGFIDRMKNAFVTTLGSLFFTQTFSTEIALLRSKFGDDFPGYEELYASMAFVFTNGNPFLNYPRPIIQKTVEIGGITIDLPNKNKEHLTLAKSWDEILNAREHNIYVSFGSVAKSIYMPEAWKNNLLAVFKTLSNTTFIWKYEEKDSKIADHLPNVHLTTWAPQNALLSDARLSLFITHGGLGSTTEVAHMGKPAILIPLFADQTRNGNMLARYGAAVVLTKYDLDFPETIKNTIESVLNNSSYSENAARLAGILQNQPISVQEKLVAYCEFAARFGALPQMDSQLRHLSLFAAYLVDIGMFFALISIVIVLILYKTTKYFVRCLVRV